MMYAKFLLCLALTVLLVGDGIRTLINTYHMYHMVPEHLPARYGWPGPVTPVEPFDRLDSRDAQIRIADSRVSISGPAHDAADIVLSARYRRITIVPHVSPAWETTVEGYRYLGVYWFFKNPRIVHVQNGKTERIDLPYPLLRDGAFYDAYKFDENKPLPTPEEFHATLDMKSLHGKTGRFRFEAELQLIYWYRGTGNHWAQTPTISVKTPVSVDLDSVVKAYHSSHK